MSRFGPDPLAFFEAVYREPAPWDIGGPQPAMAALLAEYPPESPVLDVGCGSGDLAIHIAESGIAALGIDFVEEAMAQAQAKKATLPPDVAGRLDFRVADALRPSAPGADLRSGRRMRTIRRRARTGAASGRAVLPALPANPQPWQQTPIFGGNPQI